MKASSKRGSLGAISADRNLPPKASRNSSAPPVLDGLAALKRIRASNEPWRTIPVIALTADAMSGDRERYLAEGMNGYISKPIEQRDLLAEIARLLGTGRSGPVRGEGAAAESHGAH